MRRALLLLFLAAVPAFAESIYVVDEPCTAELPENMYDKPSCADYELNSALIASGETGDESALALLEARYWITEQYQERYRIGAVLLRRLTNDGAIWDELFANAQLAVRFAGAEGEVFQQWCDEHDFYSVRHPAVLSDALSIVASDPRSHSLLLKALAADERDVALTAVFGLVEQRDLASLPAIDQTLARFPDDARYVARIFTELHDERADAIAKKYGDAEEEIEEEEVEDEEEEEQ